MPTRAYALSALTGGNQFPRVPPFIAPSSLRRCLLALRAQRSTGGNQFPRVPPFIAPSSLRRCLLALRAQRSHGREPVPPCAPHGLRRGLVSLSYCPVPLNVTLWRSSNLNRFSNFHNRTTPFLYPNPPRPACPAFFHPCQLRLPHTREYCSFSFSISQSLALRGGLVSLFLLSNLPNRPILYLPPTRTASLTSTAALTFSLLSP